MIKHVFTDVDYSFFGDDKVVSKENIEAIKRLKEKGIGFSLQSGRLVCALEDVLNDIGINNKDDEFIISGNGAIIANTNKKILFEESLAKHNIQIILDYLYTMDDLTFFVVTKDAYYVSYFPDTKIRFNDHVLITKEEIYKLVDKQKVYKFLVYDDSLDRLKQIDSKIIELTKNEIACTFSATTHLEVNNAKTNKGEGIKRFCELKGIDIKDTLAIGDNYNDETMLKVAGFTGCPSNAVEEIKQMVDYVSPYDCYHSAFADIVEHFVFKEEKK